MTKADENKEHIPDEDEFAKAWDEKDEADAGDGDRDENGQALGQEEDLAAQTADVSDDEHRSDEAQGLESGDDRTGDDEPDYRELWEKDHQRMKSWEGRLSKEAAERRALEEELARLKAQLNQNDSDSDPDGEHQDTGNQGDDNRGGVVSDAFREEYGDEIADFVEKRARELAKAEAEQLIDQRLAPLEQARQEIEVQAHYAKIAAAHPDFQEVAASESFVNWIEGLPGTFKQAAQQVVDAGTPEQVIDLLNSYKQATNADKPTAQKRDVRARRSAAVPGRSGGAPRAVPKDDFDAAWDSM